MSKLKELIDRLCPNGVEYTTLGKVTDIRRGIRVVKNNLATEGNIPVYQNSLTPLGYYTKSNFSADTAFGGSGVVPWQGYPKMTDKRNIKNGRSDIPCNCERKFLILELRDSAAALVDRFMK